MNLSPRHTAQHPLRAEQIPPASVFPSVRRDGKVTRTDLQRQRVPSRATRRLVCAACPLGTPGPHCPTGGRRAYVVVQALDDLDAVVAEIELP